MSHFNIDTEFYSAICIASWAEGRERLHSNLADIRKVAGGIIDAVEEGGDPFPGDSRLQEGRGEGDPAREREAIEEIDKYAPKFEAMRRTYSCQVDNFAVGY